MGFECLRGYTKQGWGLSVLLLAVCRFVVRELIDTEKIYVNDLAMVVEVSSFPTNHNQATL